MLPQDEKKTQKRFDIIIIVILIFMAICVMGIFAILFSTY